jgi:F-type H+-transporting ATPase subunit b
VRVLVLVAGVFVPALAVASAGAPHGEHGAPSAAQWKLLAFTATNFILFASLMVWLGRKPLRDFLVNRRKQLAQGMEEAARLKADAERLKREYEQKAAALDKMRDELVGEIRAIAQADRETSLAAAKQASERMRLDAERTAQSDLERARQDLRAEAARLAQELARDEVKRRLTDQDRKRLLNEFLESVSKS